MGIEKIGRDNYTWRFLTAGQLEVIRNALEEYYEGFEEISNSEQALLTALDAAKE